MSQIYALVDTALLKQYSIEFSSYIKFLNTLHIPVLQYRDKDGTIESIKSNLLKIKDIFNGKVIINDYMELLEYADGIHIGQEDLQEIDKTPKDAISVLRSVAKDKWIGLSTHNMEEIDTANTLDIDYIGLGAYRDTDTKKGVKRGGQKLLEIAKYSKHPVAIIGGVKTDDEFPVYISYRVIGSNLCKLYKKRYS